MRRTSPPPAVRKLLLAMTALLLLTGCGRSAPVSYYQLAPVKGEESATAATAAGNLVIGIGPVRLQEHLDRPQLITRTGANRLHLADRHRWAEPLAANIAWVLRDNLAALLATEQIRLYPWERTTLVNYQLTLEILHCEGTEDGAAHLAALWSITNGDGKTLQPPRRSSYRIPPATPDQEGLASALSDALLELSREIAGEIERLLNSTPVQNQRAQAAHKRHAQVRPSPPARRAPVGISNPLVLHNQESLPEDNHGWIDGKRAPLAESPQNHGGGGREG